MTRALRSSALILASLIAASACGPPHPPATDASAGLIAVNEARAQRVPASDRGVLYLTVRNHGPRNDRLERIVTSMASAELHETVDDDGVLRMVHRAEGFEVPAGATLKLLPGGKHVMLLDLARSTRSLPLELEFRDAGTISVEVELPPLETAR